NAIIFDANIATVTVGTFTSNIDAIFAAGTTTITSPGGITFDGDLSTTNNTNLNLLVTGGTITFGGNIGAMGAEFGTLNISDASQLTFTAATHTVYVYDFLVGTTTNTTFVGNGTTTINATMGDISFAGDIDGTGNLTLSAPMGEVIFGGNIGTAMEQLSLFDVSDTPQLTFTAGNHDVYVNT